MDLARDHRLSHPRLRPYNRVDARFEWPAVPASDRRGLDRDGVIRPLDHHDRLQTPRTLGLVRFMVLPPLLDGAPPTAGCGDIDPCRTPCTCERLSTPSDEGYARIMLRGSTTLKTAVMYPTMVPR